MNMIRKRKTALQSATSTAVAKAYKAGARYVVGRNDTGYASSWITYLEYSKHLQPAIARAKELTDTVPAEFGYSVKRLEKDGSAYVEVWPHKYGPVYKNHGEAKSASKSYTHDDYYGK